MSFLQTFLKFLSCFRLKAFATAWFLAEEKPSNALDNVFCYTSWKCKGRTFLRTRSMFFTISSTWTGDSGFVKGFFSMLKPQIKTIFTSGHVPDWIRKAPLNYHISSLNWSLLIRDGSITLLTIKRSCNHQVEGFCGGLQPLLSSGEGFLRDFVAFWGYFCKVIIPFCLLTLWVRAGGAALQNSKNLPPCLKWIGEWFFFSLSFLLTTWSLGQRQPNISFPCSTNHHRDLGLVWSHLRIHVRQSFIKPQHK